MGYMDDKATTVATTYAGPFELGGDNDPHGPYDWDHSAQRWVSRCRCDLATTTHHTLRGTFQLRWYRRNGTTVWRSVDGGSAADDTTQWQLDAELALQIAQGLIAAG